MQLLTKMLAFSQLFAAVLMWAAQSVTALHLQRPSDESTTKDARLVAEAAHTAEHSLLEESTVRSFLQYIDNLSHFRTLRDEFLQLPVHYQVAYSGSALVVSLCCAMVLTSSCRSGVRKVHKSSIPKRFEPLIAMIAGVGPVVVLWGLTAVLAVAAYEGCTIATVLLALPLFFELLHRVVHAKRIRDEKFVGADLAFNVHANTWMSQPSPSDSAPRVIMTTGTTRMKFATEQDAQNFCDVWNAAVRKNCEPGAPFSMYVSDEKVEFSKDIEQSIRDTLPEGPPLPWNKVVMSNKCHVLKLNREGSVVDAQCMIRHDVVDGYATLCLFAECCGLPKPVFEMQRDLALCVRLLEINPLMYYLAPPFMSQFVRGTSLPEVHLPPHLNGIVEKDALQPLVQRLDCSPAMVLQASMVRAVSRVMGREICVGFIVRVTGLLHGVRNTLCGVNVRVPEGCTTEEIVELFKALKTSPSAVLQMSASCFLMNRFHVAYTFGAKIPQGTDSVDVAISSSILTKDEDAPCVKAYTSFKQDAFLRRPVRIVTQVVGPKFVVDVAYIPDLVPGNALVAELGECVPELQEVVLS